MPLANIVEHNPKFSGDYTGVIVSRKDPLNQGRLYVKVPELLGEEPIWAQAECIAGFLTIVAIPPEGQEVKVHFNGTPYDCTWKAGNISKDAIIDVDEILIKDDKGNTVTWHRLTGRFVVNASDEIELVSKTRIKLSAPVIDLDGTVKCKNGATGPITMLTSALASYGIVTQTN